MGEAFLDLALIGVPGMHNSSEVRVLYPT
jgi:hypothetical protein